MGVAVESGPEDWGERQQFLANAIAVVDQVGADVAGQRAAEAVISARSELDADKAWGEFISADGGAVDRYLERVLGQYGTEAWTSRRLVDGLRRSIPGLFRASSD